MNSEYRVIGIPSHLVEHFWHFAEPYIKRALDHASGEMLPEDMRAACMNKDMQLWLISHGERVVGASTTELVVYPRRKHCRIITLAGSHAEDWAADADKLIVAWAREQGCDAVETINRRGFIPKLEKAGYRFRQAVMIKQVEPLPREEAL